MNIVITLTISFLVLIGFQLQFNFIDYFETNYCVSNVALKTFNYIFFLFEIIWGFIKTVLLSSFSISLMALTVSSLSVYFAYLIFKRTTEKSVEDDYWLRTVLLPGYLDLLMDFTVNIPDKVKSYPEVEDFYEVKWWTDINDKLSRRSQLIAIHSPSIYREIDNLMGDFEDELGGIFDSNNPDKDIEVEQSAIKLFKSIMSVIKREQHKQVRLFGNTKNRP